MTFRLSNRCPDFLMMETDSRSRKGLEHTLVVCKRTGVVSCSCEDAVYRKKQGHLLDRVCPHACDHVKAFAASAAPLIAQALGVQSA